MFVGVRADTLLPPRNRRFRNAKQARRLLSRKREQISEPQDAVALQPPIVRPLPFGNAIPPFGKNVAPLHHESRIDGARLALREDAVDTIIGVPKLGKTHAKRHPQ